MRRARLLGPADWLVGVYHCVSRVVDGQFILDRAAKAHFVALMREYETFCEVQVLTHVVMSDHFHLLVAVPKRPEVLPAAQEIVAKLRRLTGHQNVDAVEQRLKAYRFGKDFAGEAAYLGTFHERMWNVGAFMKLIKQRFTQWYNSRAGRKGTLWEDRFKSVLVEGKGEALAAMAAYLDLNPVRAGLVTEPGDYRWSGYGEALAGGRQARQGLRRLVAAIRRGQELSPRASLAAYRQFLSAECGQPVPDEGPRVHAPVRPAKALRVLNAKGRLGLGDYLRCRVRYFSDGAVMGSREFVEEVFGKNRDWFGSKRKAGARKMRGLTGVDLFTVRDLRLDVFGKRKGPMDRRKGGDRAAAP